MVRWRLVCVFFIWFSFLACLCGFNTKALVSLLCFVAVCIASALPVMWLPTSEKNKDLLCGILWTLFFFGAWLWRRQSGALA